MTQIQLAYGVGTPQVQVLPPPQFFESKPTGSNWSVGQIAFTGSVGAYTFYIYSGNGVWEILDSASGAILTITGNSGGAESPDGSGNFNIVGTGSITTVGSANTETVELTGLTNHALLVGAGTATITKLPVGTTGQILTGVSADDPAWTTATYPATATAGSLIAATATNVIGQIADVAVGQVLMSGGVGVIPAYTGSPSVSGSLTAATTITATLGNITATAGNFVSSTAGDGLMFNATTASGAASGPVVLNSRAGKVTFTGVSIAAAADLTLTMTNSAITSSSTQIIYSLAGATTGSALSVKSVTPGSGTVAFVITNGTGATTTTADISITFLIVN
jgi:hypothetical protein